MSNLLRKYYQKFFNEYGLSVLFISLINLYFLRSVFQAATIVFLVVSVLTLVFSIILLIKNRFTSLSFKVLRGFILFFILLLIFLFYAIQALPNEFIFKLLAHTGIVLGLFFYPLLILKESEYYKTFRLLFVKQFKVLAIIVAVISLFKLYTKITSLKLFLFLPNTGDYLGSSLAPDNNFFAAYLIIGLFLNVHDFYKPSFKFTRRQVIESIIFSLSIATSFSRRALVTWIFLTSVFLVVRLFYVFKTKYKDAKEVRNASRSILFIIIVCIIMVLPFFTPLNIRLGVSKISGIKYRRYQEFMTVLYYRYFTIIDNPTSYDISIWNYKFDSNNPDTWGHERDFKKVVLNDSALFGNSENVFAYKLDSTSNATIWDDNAYSFTNYYTHTCNIGEDYIATVYSYVPVDFNGNWVSLYIDDGSGRVIKKDYNLHTKGRWQKLTIQFRSRGERVKCYLYFSQRNADSFRNLDGYVLFALPNLKIVDYPQYYVSNQVDPYFTAKRNLPENPIVMADNNFTTKVDTSKLPAIRVDKNSQYSSWSNNSYSFSNIVRINAAKGESYRTKVYCYVSEDFNGNFVALTIEGNKFYKDTKYHLSQKGVWKQLYTDFTTQIGYYNINSYVGKYGVTNFENLKGYVLFSYPELIKGDVMSSDPARGWARRIYKPYYPKSEDEELLFSQNSVGYLMDSTCNANTWNDNAYSYTQISTLQTDSNDIYIASVYCYVSPEFNGTWAKLTAFDNKREYMSAYYDIDKKGEWQELNIKFKGTGKTMPVYLYWCLEDVLDFKSLDGHVIFMEPKVLKVHPNYEIVLGRDVAININDYVTSNQYYPKSIEIEKQIYSASLIDLRATSQNAISKKMESVLFKSRFSRWRYALQIWKNEYSLPKKIFGNGFQYLHKFGDKYQNNSRFDYPHNPVLSHLLFSGLVGALIYVIFLFLSIYYYFKYRSLCHEFFIIYIIVFFFTFFSGDTHFSVPMLSFFSLVPFLIHYLNKNRNITSEKSNK